MGKSQMLGGDDEGRVLRQIIEATPNAMVMVNEFGLITLVNSQTEHQFGYSREELLSMTVDRLIPDRFRPRHKGFREGFFDNPDTRSMGAGRDLFGLHSDGREFPIEIGLNPVIIDDRPQVLASIIDITERKRAEERLLHVVEAAPNAMIMVNSLGHIVLVNTQTERSFGYSRDELLSMNIEDLIPTRFKAKHDGYRMGYFHNPDRREMGAGRELFGRRKDGSEIPVEIGLNPIQVLDEQHVLASVIDITERLVVQATESAERADRLRRSILDSLPFSIIATDSNGLIVTANPAAERLLHAERNELVGSRISEIRDGRLDQVPLLAVRTHGVDEREVEYHRRDGVDVPVNEAISLIVDEVGEVTGYLAVAYDITQRKEAEAFIRHMAHYDFLTDLPNRTMLFTRLDAELERAAREKTGLAVIMLDLDHFKRVNDSLGHHIGDELLLQMAARLRSEVRTNDLVSRFGGDEFVLVFTDVQSAEELTERITALLELIPEPLICNGHELIVSASLGGSLFPQNGSDSTTLIKHADTAMYHAKSAARNSFQWFRDSMLDETNDKLVMAAALRHALDRGEITVAYQPEINLTSGEVVGLEALARWNDIDGSEIPPDRFIPVAEDNGLIIRLGEHILRTACADAMRISESLGRPMRLAVNVSPRQLRDKEWLTVLKRALADSGLSGNQLELEITEGIFMEDPRTVVEMLNTVRALGVAIVVDDFGTGFSSLAYLTRFPIDKIKIDRSFIHDLVDSSADAAIVDTIIVMAHTLGMTVVAEGVETEQQEIYLRAKGCDQAQGFRYSRAVPVEQFAAAIS
ncbi:diguanylate cyclase (GGDEF)-like protein/PAS domain S-box-containing protein [Aeromicrobium panaciterrae]|uniref:Diguanylate cyclase (GGDEF)-like protein/PAS domain S-box-containing protein n=1 Tax=Aeromicrobium panaciterrae TaxID=363861 RepID=A0ABU1UNA8_9ACTN|nr:EAL domain-containing protein [Aeromicrobium panaciterrae]MDR7086647.1 diguanylate cyclase (GGDEF)-like protein/PAS domain S-box-containing protein [Aeromicrobium panaciterrae]